MSSVVEKAPLEGIAVIGLACRFPGAKNVDEFWLNLKNGTESVTSFSEQELLSSGVDHNLLRHPNYINAAAVIEDIDQFDASFFGFNRREAEITDPQQRLFFECAYEALEQAGYDPRTYQGLIGVYAGVGMNAYIFNLAANRSLTEAVGSFRLSIGNEKDFVATRLAYKLGLKGPAVTVQSACSTSLVAVHLACQSLFNYECDIAMAGAASISLPQKAGSLYHEGSIMSPDGHCRAFDARAQGTVRGNGVGVVVLKRLSDALADGDHVDAVIKGSAINNDGALKVGFTAPSAEGQAAAIALAQSVAGVAPEAITYIEAHGTGTPLGDPIEVAALNRVFRDKTDKKGFCALGSVKTNIGHLDTAAGMAGLIKTVLALKYKLIPASLHFEHPNPNIDFADSPFYVNTQLAEWTAGTYPRQAGVSSFGIGGTNAHVILEEAPPPARVASTKPGYLLVLSARTAPALDAATTNLARHLETHQEIDLADVAYTLQAGRGVFKHRRMLVCRDRDDAVATLDAQHPKRTFTADQPSNDRPVVFLFPGQGTQHIRMAAELYQHEPSFREQVDRCVQLLRPHLGLDLRDVIYPRAENVEEAAHQLQQTALTQPALFVIEYALARLWMQWGVQPRALIGHSIGEYVAACVAGVLSLEDALALVAARGRLMQQLPSGAMLMVLCPERDVQPLLGARLSLAAVNGPTVCVVAGPPEDVQQLEHRLGEQDVMCRRLHTSHAFHSAMMDPILEPFAAQVRQVQLKEPQLPYISNVTGAWISGSEASDPDYWVRHTRQAVRFGDGLRTLLQESERVLLEVGPGRTLSTLAKRHPDKKDGHVVLASLPAPCDQESDWAHMSGAVGQLWLAGVAVDWEGMHLNEQIHRVPLPTYPFERQQYWIAPTEKEIDSTLRAPERQESQHVAHADVDQASASTTEPHKEVDMAQAQMIAPSARYTKILSTLGKIMGDLTGEELDDIGTQTTLLDTGFDSLLLIQFNQAIRDELGVRISLIQLLEDYTTLDSIATYIDHQLPSEALTEEPAQEDPSRHMEEGAVTTALSPGIVNGSTPPDHGRQAATPVPAPAPSPAATNDTGITPGFPPQLPSIIPATAPIFSAPYDATFTPPSDPAISQIMTQQLQVVSQLMAHQLDVLRNGGGHMSTVVSVDPVLPVPRQATEQLAEVVPATADDQRQSSHSNGSPQAPSVAGLRRIEPALFVPHQPIQTGSAGSLTSRQQKYLDTFITRYTSRTQQSKLQTQRYRPAHADSRTTTKFRRLWKEMVYPIIGQRSAGSKIWDVDGNEYVDITMGFGVHLFGHSPRFIMDAMERQLKEGVQLGPQSYLAGSAAELLCELTGTERATFCNSGTEAVMAALRVARTHTHRTKIACFSGSYHGWFDGTLARPLPAHGELHSVPAAPGVPPHAVEDVLVLEYGNPQSLDVLRAHAHELAAVLVEPVQSRRPDLQPRSFLHELRDLTEKSGTVLIFDEMINGFRIHPGGAQSWFDVRADLVTYGKIVGGGMPIGVIAGKAVYMDAFDGGMWDFGDQSYPQAEKTLFGGAFFKHPLTMAATWAVLNHLKDSGPALQEQLNQRTAGLADTINAFFVQQEVPIQVVHFSSLFRFNFSREDKFQDLFLYHLVEQGVYIWEGANMFLSTAHTDADIEHVIRAVKESVADLRAGGFFPDTSPDSPRGRSGAIVEAGERDRSMEPAADQASNKSTTSCASNSLCSTTSGTMQDQVPAPATREGLQFSLYYFGNYDAAFRSDKYDLLFDGARFADKHGFTAVWIPERHFHPFGGLSPNPAVLAAALARETERVHIRAGSVALPLHHPIRVAEEWALVDNLSHGRVGVSMASGWHPDDFVFTPDLYENRQDVMQQSIEIVQRLWRGEAVQFRGGTGNDVAAKLFPMPAQARLPLWLTGAHPKTFITAGELGVGVLTMLQNQTIEELEEKIRAYRRSLCKNGHDPESGQVTVLIHTYIDKDRQRALETARAPFYGYIKSSFELNGGKAKSQGRAIDLDKASEDDLNYICSEAYDRYVRAGALIGDPSSCSATIEQLIASGVDEVACLIDFGIDSAAALDSLHYLDGLREQYQGATQARRSCAVTPNGGVAGEQVVPATPPCDTCSQDMQIVPLTGAQKALWFLAHLVDGDASLYNESITLHLRGGLDAAALQEALHEVIMRHEALRTTIGPEGEHQHIAPTVTTGLPVTDLSAVDDDQQTSLAADVLVHESRHRFDLVRGPLLATRLVKLTEDHHLLVLTIHHIVTDGWSMNIILEDLAAVYAARSEGAESRLPVPMQFREYVQWLERQERDGEMARAEGYWLEQFSGSIPVTDLPTDRPRPAVQTYAGAECDLEISAATFRKLKNLSRQKGCTLFMTLLAAFDALVHRLTGQDDIVVGVPSAGQPLVGGVHLVGYCINMLPLRSTIASATTFADHLRAVKRRLMEAYEYQYYPLSQLVAKLNVPRDPRRAPLVNVAFNLETTGDDLTIPGLCVETTTNSSTFARFDLHLNVVEIDGGLSLTSHYNTDLFDRQTVECWLAYFQILIDEIVDQPDQLIADISLLPSNQRQLALTTWNDTEAELPPIRCVHQLFDEQAACMPDAIAVVFGETQLTYHDINQRANQVAHYLQQQGISPELRVGICMDRSPDMIVGLLGILKAGGAYVPLDPTYPQGRLHVMLQDAEVQIVLTQERWAEELPQCEAAIVCLDTDWAEIAQAPMTSPSSSTTAENLAYVMYTSGSTGRPKGVCIPHRAIIRLVCNTNYVQLDSSERVAQASNASFDAATFEIWGALLHGARLVGIATDTLLAPRDFATIVREQEISTMFLTTALFNNLASEVPTVFDSMHNVLFGGEAVDPHWVREVLAKGPPQRLLHVYGPTESTTFASYHLVEDISSRASTIPIGRPLSNTQMYLLDRNLHLAPVSMPGELYISGAGLAVGYLNQPALTAERFIPHPFSKVPGARLYKTGDVARYATDGAIEFMGRIDQQVKIRGYRIEPDEIALVLADHSSVREAVVVAHEVVPGDKRLVAYVVLRPDQAPSLVEVRRFAQTRLPDYMVPAAFMLLDALPLTPNGKLDRHALPTADVAATTLKSDYVAPRTHVEEQVAQAWMAVLGVDRVGVRDSFFDVGGNSLLAVRLISRLRDTLRVELSVRTLFEMPTIADLAVVVARDLTDDVDSQTLSHMLTELETLSEDDVQAQLEGNTQAGQEDA
jgi:iturin family lipopeptide synthetase A